MRKVFVILRGGARIFMRNGSLDKAAAISFYAFFSLIPILLITTVILGFILGTKEGLTERVVMMTKKSLPYMGPRIITDLKAISEAWGTLGWISIVMLVVSAEFVLTAASDALQDIFGVPRKHGFVRRKLTNIMILLMPAAAALFSIAVTALSGIVEELDLRFLGIELSRYFESLILTHLLPFFLMVMSVSLVYWIVSGKNLSYDYSFYGSLLFAALWEGGKQLFAWYISVVPTYSTLYSSVGTVMLLLLWIFFTMVIFLFSASVARAAYTGKSGVPV